ncbi:MAG: hypothetical protein V2A54_16300 [Bacteroidota bacterium]
MSRWYWLVLIKNIFQPFGFGGGGGGNGGVGSSPSPPLILLSSDFFNE